MNALAPFILLMAGFGTYCCFWASRRWLKQLKGEQQFTLTNLPIPWMVWPLIVFTALMFIAASVPVLLGQPMWLLEKIFYVIAMGAK